MAELSLTNEAFFVVVTERNSEEYLSSLARILDRHAHDSGKECYISTGHKSFFSSIIHSTLPPPPPARPPPPRPQHGHFLLKCIRTNLISCVSLYYLSIMEIVLVNVSRHLVLNI